MPFCYKCHKNKPIKSFYKDGSKGSGHRSLCKECDKNRRKIYYIANNEEVKNKVRLYGIANVDNKRLYNKQYRKKNKKRLRQRYRLWVRKKLQSDPYFKLVHSLRNRIKEAIRGRYKSGSAIKDLGCSIDFLKKYLENKFYNHPLDRVPMSWGLHGAGDDKWQIDHIIPLHKFDLTNREQFIRAVHYSNLQPLWYIDHVHKHRQLNNVK